MSLHHFVLYVFQTIIAIGKALVFLLDWPTMHSIAVGVCQLILPRLYTNVPNLNSTAMCPGYIANYGEHVSKRKAIN